MTDGERQELQTIRVNPGRGSPVRRAYLEALERASRAQVRLLHAEQWAHLGEHERAAWDVAREAFAQAEAEVAAATAAKEARRRDVAERAREAAAIVPPDPGDREVRELLARLLRQYVPGAWDAALRERGDPVAQRALRHLGWLRQVYREGSQV